LVTPAGGTNDMPPGWSPTSTTPPLRKELLRGGTWDGYSLSKAFTVCRYADTAARVPPGFVVGPTTGFVGGGTRGAKGLLELDASELGPSAVPELGPLGPVPGLELGSLDTGVEGASAAGGGEAIGGPPDGGFLGPPNILGKLKPPASMRPNTGGLAGPLVVAIFTGVLCFLPSALAVGCLLAWRGFLPSTLAVCLLAWRGFLPAALAVSFLAW
jgi:hypothetical protein